MKKKILVIEDQAPMRRNIALLLEMAGYEVVTAATGHAVVQSLRAEEATATTPFIFLTARGDKADVRIGMNFGADDYLTKPVMRDDLVAAAHARLGRDASRQ